MWSTADARQDSRTTAAFQTSDRGPYHVPRIVGRLAVLTDSTACLPAEVAEAAGITVVPLHVVINGESYPEGTDDATARLDEALHRHWSATTSRPGPATMLAAYRQLAAAGAEGIVSVHLSSLLSGTYESATVAAREAPVPVRVVDSQTLGMALGFAVLEAGVAVRDTATIVDLDSRMSAVAEAATRRASECGVLFYVDTLDYLRRGGRISPAQAILGTTFAVKPLLHVIGGRIEVLEKVRTANRALARLADLAVEHAGDRAVDIAVQHQSATARAAELALTLRDRLPDLGDSYLTDVGVVIGAHAGSGVVGAVIAPR